MDQAVSFGNYRFDAGTGRLWSGRLEVRLLERVFARGWGKLDWVAHDPDYDSLRGDPRFQRLVGKLK